MDPYVFSLKHVIIRVSTNHITALLIESPMGDFMGGLG